MPTAASTNGAHVARPVRRPPTASATRPPISVATSSGAGALRVARGVEAVVHERAMRRHDDVDAHVRERAGERQHQERRAVAERDRRQAPRGEEAAAHDERPPPVPRRVAPVAPAADEERHREAGGGVDHHHQPDQGRRLPDVSEQEREIRRRHGADEARADSRRGEDDQVAEAAPRTERERENARELCRYERVAGDGCVLEQVARDGALRVLGGAVVEQLLRPAISAP